MTSGVGVGAWVVFNVAIVLLLLVDLFVFHRKAHEIGAREAAISSAFWIALGLGFAVILRFWLGGHAALTYLTGFVIEKSLSVDNLFVFVVIFAYFAVPLAYQHRVLFWGILGVLVMRGILIAVGAALLARVSWLTYVFGAFLVIAAIRMGLHRGTEIHPEKNPVVKIARRLFPVTETFDGQRLITRRDGLLVATPLLIVLLVIETSDLIFALDSIPAIFAVTRDTFIVYTSTVFAILGLRSLYFLLARVVHKFRFLNYGLAVVLAFVGSKMILHSVVEIPTPVSLAVIAGVIGVSIALSVWIKEPRPVACPFCRATLLEDDDICPNCEEIVWPPSHRVAVAGKPPTELPTSDE